MNKKLLSVIIFLVLCASFLFVYLDDYIREKRSATLHVVTTTNAMNYYENDSVKGGINYLLVKSLADSLGLNLKIEIEDKYKRRVRGLRNGRYDIMLTLMPITTESKKDFLFTKPIAVGHLVLVQNKENDTLYIDDFSQLNGKTIYVEKHKYSELVLENMKEELGLDYAIEEIENTDYDKLSAMVSRGEIAYAVMDNHSAQLAQEKYSNLDINFNMGFNQFFGWPMEHHKKKLKSQLDNYLFTSFSLSHIAM